MGFFKWFKKEKQEENINTLQNDTQQIKENVNEEVQEIEQNIDGSKHLQDLQEISQNTDDSKHLQEVQEISQNTDNKHLQEVQEISQNTDDNKHLQEVQEISQNTDDSKHLQDLQEISQNTDDNKHLQDLQETPQNTDDNKQLQDVQEPKKKGFFTKIKMGLSKTRDSILNGVEQVLSSFTKIDEELFEELEESLIMSDIGVETSVYIIEKVREIVKTERIKDVKEIKDVIIRVISDILEEETKEFSLKSPSVILVIGVNGVGKTTTIGKLANNYKKEGKKVLLAAADTFRAAAIDQLQVWGERSNIDVIKHQEGSDPAAVVFDAIQAGKARGTDLLICDTAGRLHNKKNLMEELKKIARIVTRENPDAQIETLLVLDATTGQNALQQAKLFSQVSDITGIVLTKLDGTAKGGVVIAIKNELKIPVRFIGVGEGIDDLRPFDAKEFSKALFE
ncbi:signal recognition particle-docking protein FtsY [uncultured Tyzzerella sp.]|uniref:signal recognition particle-docking protein FtsY n=1 Tax=uncultured Tyzzerella sp. TaxID=2321398 RepID=UPI002941EEA7|nr:signal recognition particle-docking protein FtsY [uncultured Tyzzerella sp.]